MATSRSDPASLRKDAARGRPFDRVLIANRGEIAVRIIRACRELGIETVAVYSDADATARHVRLADAAVRIGPPAPAESYLRVDVIVEAALSTGASAVHPGYGFLAERAAFATAVEAAGLVFVGPSPDTIAALGDKLAARRLARAVGVPAVPGTLDAAAIGGDGDVARVTAEAAGIGFPLLVKAAAGGGGRGMRRVEREADLVSALAAASAEAASAFGDGAVYLERELRPARHVEVQLLGDATGRVIALGERDCSLQRRHQKLVEEAPAPGLTPAARRDLHGMAVRLGEAARLVNAATAEFLMTPDGTFHFLEMNTRLQVEHGVTELVSGVDIVAEQLLLAAGRPLSAAARRAADEAAEPRGHAIEVRLSAEDPATGFAPASGVVNWWSMPAGPGVRVDSAIESGDRIPPDYDNLVAKLLVHAGDRGAAIDRLRRALDEVEIGGIQTTLPFHRFVATNPAFRGAALATDWVEQHWDGPAARSAASVPAQVVAAVAAAAPPASAAAGPVSAPSSSTDGAWARAGRRAAIDRWPR